MSSSWRAARHMPPAEAFAHGTRARYVCGCRCAPCKGSNVKRYHERQTRAKALALEISAPAKPVPQTWTAPDGSKQIRFYARACPGVNGNPCPIRAHLRKDSVGGVCRRCRDLLIFDGLVPAQRARAHILKLSRAGVGYKSISAACDVAGVILMAIRSGYRKQLRASTERRILAVDRHALAGKALVPAGQVWHRIGLLLDEGFTKAELARRLGLQTPAIQFKTTRVTAETVVRVERLYRRCVA